MKMDLRRAAINERCGVGQSLGSGQVMVELETVSRVRNRQMDKRTITWLGQGILLLLYRHSVVVGVSLVCLKLPTRPQRYSVECGGFPLCALQCLVCYFSCLVLRQRQ